MATPQEKFDDYWSKFTALSHRTFSFVRPAALFLGPVLAGTAAPLLIRTGFLAFGPRLWSVVHESNRSVRSEHVLRLRAALEEAASRGGKNQIYTVVIGPKGVGKSCLIQTALDRTHGVFRVGIAPGLSCDDIVNKTLQIMIRPHFLPQEWQAWLMIWLHKKFTGRTPIAVLEAKERRQGANFAQLTSAVRTLVDNYQLRVVVDASPNSLEDGVLETERANIFTVQPLDRKDLEGLSDLQELMALLHRNNLKDEAWAILGGNPAKYLLLWTKYQDALVISGQRDPGIILRELLVKLVNEAIAKVVTAREEDKKMDFICAKFEETLKDVPVKGLGGPLPSPNKIFSVVHSDKDLLTPASGAIRIALCNKLTEDITFEHLHQILSKCK